MAKIKYRDIRFKRKSLRLLDKVVSIVEEYQVQDIKLTLRQLYYQLVARDIILNLQTEYNKLGRLVRNARYCGLVDWGAIEDRVRMPSIPNEFEDIADLVDAAVNNYRLDRWEGQEYYVELFTEKDALSSVLAPIADKWHIPFCVNRGYGSTTAFFDTSERIRTAIDSRKEPVILYLGDHDPSGLDMVRDIEERLIEFCYSDSGIRVVHIALTSEQVREYSPPPNPAKFTDTRAAEYTEKYGRHCWEVDALPPNVLNEIVDKAIGELVDVERMDAIIEKEESDKRKLRTWSQDLQDKNEA